MKKICYIIVYFGQLPDTMKLWLNSCEFNSSINWLIYTDDRNSYDYPSNVVIKRCCLEDFKKIVQRKFRFEVRIDTPYRLCDYKVAYGYIFEEELEEYDFWGYCDLDMVFGNIRDFLTNDILDAYDRIGFLGHSTLYKNSYDMNRLFMRNLDGRELYKEFFGSGGNENYFFDEKWMDLLCEEYKVKTYRKTVFADVIPWAWKFRIGYVHDIEKIKNEHRIFLWDNGELFSYSIGEDKKVIVDRYMYIHLLKRSMNDLTSCDTDRYLIVPNLFLPYNKNITKKTIYFYSLNNMLLYWLDVLKRKWRKVSLENIIRYFRIRKKAKKQYYK